VTNEREERKALEAKWRNVLSVLFFVGTWIAIRVTRPKPRWWQ
jgi:hypothetical protein